MAFRRGRRRSSYRGRRRFGVGARRRRRFGGRRRGGPLRIGFRM